MSRTSRDGLQPDSSKVSKPLEDLLGEVYCVDGPVALDVEGPGLGMIGKLLDDEGILVHLRSVGERPYLLPHRFDIADLGVDFADRVDTVSLSVIYGF